MKYYEQLVDLQCFTKADVVNLVGNPRTATSLLLDYQKRSLIESVKRNLYVAISLETKQSIANRFLIGSKVTDDAYITHHSAFEYYGYSNQVFNELYISGDKRFNPFQYDGFTYRYLAPRIQEGVDVKLDGIHVTDIERTVLDSINDFEKVAGLEELLRCLELIPYVDEEKLLVYLGSINKQVLYQKTGYILEHYKNELRLSDLFFDTCKKSAINSVRYLYNGIQNEPKFFNSYWNLIVPRDLMMRMSKTGEANGTL